MKTEQNQQFTSMDAAGLFAGLVLVALISTPIVLRRINHQNSEVARREALEWSQKVTLNEISGSDGERGPASESDRAKGLIGSDPWGRPYHYKYLSNEMGQPVYIAVWSTGANAESETRSEDLVLSENGVPPEFKGDDVGFIRAVR